MYNNPPDKHLIEMRIFKIFVLLGITFFFAPIKSAVFDINTPAYISCISDESAELITIGEYEGDNPGDKLRADFFKWVFDKVEKNLKARIDFVWKPKTKKGPKIEIITKDESYHTFVSVRSKTNNSIIVVSSASQVNTVVSWLFTFNFNLKTMLASRVQSGVANVSGKVMTFDCNFKNIVGQGDSGALIPIDVELNLSDPNISEPGTEGTNAATTN